ncbi:MAG: enoyl-CoA hydratase/isomerase family protein [Acidobacteria bacterium]|nr:enoyl-CoA hydratase/isomerase family protein [Acidobacteriota bacterium]
MTELIRYMTENDIAVVTIDNPPVNALGPGVAEGIAAALSRAESDANVRAIVVIGAGKTFVAGADIKEFAKMRASRECGPGHTAFLLRVENCAKPVVMAIHGTAFGGGLELAMAGHYRVATPNAQVGQPEVKLGIIPGAGGTQRLPRLVGIAKAAEMCSLGEPVNARDACDAGIIDKLVEGASEEVELRAAAVVFAREVAGEPVRKTRERTEKLNAGTDSDNLAIFDKARGTARKKLRGRHAPLAAIDAVEAATKLPFERGLARERELFIECLFSQESSALIHAFFGEREVVKIPDVPKQTQVRPIHSAAVVGAGTMGGGIAMVFANAGIPVLLKETDQTGLDRGLATIRSNYANSVKRGRFTQEYANQRMALITPTLTYDEFASADVVIEAVFESMALKKDIFAELSRVCKPNAVLASNTSTLSIDEIASATSRPETVIGTHFFSPANVMRLLEVVRGAATSKETIARSMQLSKRLGKVGVLVGNCRGFVGNRMFHPYRREAQFLVEEGASIEAVDRALYDFGMAMGPLSVADLAGLDIGWRIRKEHRHLEKPGVRQPLPEDRLCEMGRYGQKTCAGWYRYDEQRRQIPDPEVTELVRGWSREKGIDQREISSDEIVERCIYALVNEGARILDEGFALRAVDIDIIYLNGYGFPAHRGGPMFYADTVGLKRVHDRVCDFERIHGENWRPAPLLKRLAEQGKTFADFQKS